MIKIKDTYIDFECSDWVASEGMSMMGYTDQQDTYELTAGEYNAHIEIKTIDGQQNVMATMSKVQANNWQMDILALDLDSWPNAGFLNADGSKTLFVDQSENVDFLNTGNGIDTADHELVIQSLFSTDLDGNGLEDIEPGHLIAPCKSDGCLAEPRHLPTFSGNNFHEQGDNAGV